MTKKKFKIPNTFVIVFGFILLAAVGTWILPGGSYKRHVIEENGSKREIILRDSFQYEEANPQVFEIFEAPLKGFIRMAEIIAFVFFVGGAFYVFQKTGAIDAAIHATVRRMKGREKLVIAVIMILFSFFGAFFGMCEEAMPFVLIFVPLALAMGYDSITGLCFSFLAAGIGFATAFFNPFTVQIAQKFAEIPPVSGWEFRVAIWLVITGFSIMWVIRYADRVKKNPELSPTFKQDQERRRELAEDQQTNGDFTRSHGTVLVVLLVGIIMLFYGVIALKWYITELAALFLVMGILAGAIGGLGPSRIAEAFIDGAKDIASAALIIGFAGGIIVILEDGNIMDTVLHGMARASGENQPLIAVYMQYGVQLVLNFFIPSGTTKAALTMPLFAPLADLAGFSRQIAVLAYQFGDGFTNMIIPTSGVTVGTLAMAKVPFEKWFKWLLPLEIIFIGLSLVILAGAVMMGWTGI